MNMRLLLLGFALTAVGIVSVTRATDDVSADADTSIADEYRQHRAAFQAERERLVGAAPALELELAEREEQLRELRAELAALESAGEAGERGAEDLAGLRRLNSGVEAASFLFLQPFAALTAWALHDSDSTEMTRRPVVPGETVSRYLSFVLPVTLLVLLWLARRFKVDVAGEHRRPLQWLVLAAVLILPLSSFAQNAPAAPAPAASPDSELGELLEAADEMLGLTRVQRYLQWLSAERSAGRRLRISDVDLSATPFIYFDSVVGGSGEFHMTLAALHYANGDRNAALRQMLALADPGTRYATRNANPQEYEAIFATAAAFLMDHESGELAEEILRLHLPELRRGDTFDLVYPKLIAHESRDTALALAEQLMAQTTDGERLVAYAGALYRSDFPIQGQSALRDALEHMDSEAALRAGFDLALEQREDGLLQRILARAGQQIDELTTTFLLVDALRDGARVPAARALLASAIEQAGDSAGGLRIAGVPATRDQALAYISAQAFDRDMLSIAEAAATAAIGPLSRVERTVLTMPAPSSVRDPLRIPEPDRLVAPLYFGLLEEQRGRSGSARQRYAAESRQMLASLRESNGLYVPDMMNHLALLGSTLNPESEADTLARLDRVLLRLEEASLEKLRGEQSAVSQGTRSRLATLDAQVAELRAESTALATAQMARERSLPGLVLSAVLLVLRSAILLTLCGACLFLVARRALEYSRERTMHRGHAFGWKLFEGMGWTWVASLLSAPLGLLAVVLSQLFLLFQERTEHSFEHRKTVGPPVNPVKSAPATLRPRPEAATAESERADQEWSKVIQMLRET